MKIPRLSERLIDLLIDGAKTMGLEDAYGYIEERLYVDEAEAVESFFKWLVANNKTFGHGNIKQIWQEWAASQKISSSEQILKIAKLLEAKTVTISPSTKTRAIYDELDPETTEFALLWIAKKKGKPGAKEKFEAAGAKFIEGKPGFVGSGHWRYEYKGNIFEVDGTASGRGFWGTDYGIFKEKKAVAAFKLQRPPKNYLGLALYMGNLAKKLRVLPSVLNKYRKEIIRAYEKGYSLSNLVDDLSDDPWIKQHQFKT